MRRSKGGKKRGRKARFRRSGRSLKEHGEQ
jgi:hypothetical protein